VLVSSICLLVNMSVRSHLHVVFWSFIEMNTIFTRVDVVATPHYHANLLLFESSYRLSISI